MPNSKQINMLTFWFHNENHFHGPEVLNDVLERNTKIDGIVPLKTTDNLLEVTGFLNWSFQHS